jgi:hypothetical protein
MQIVHFFCPQQEVHCKMQGIRPSSTKNSLISLHREKQKQRNPKTHSTPERFLVDNIKPDFSWRKKKNSHTRKSTNGSTRIVSKKAPVSAKKEELEQKHEMQKRNPQNQEKKLPNR